MAHDASVLRVQGLTKSFGDRVAVNDIHFAIASGETYEPLGPNGAGKTTVISMVAGLRASDSGDVVVAESRCTPAPSKQSGPSGWYPGIWPSIPI
jgi:ABC-type multidrug transport system ATPase subunit